MPMSVNVCVCDKVSRAALRAVIAPGAVLVSV